MRYTVLALALAVTAITARADAAGGPLAVQTMTLKGRCNQLEIPEIIKREIPKTVTTENCIGTLISLSSADGQILFSFVTKDGVTISFAGPNQTKPDSNSAVLSLETVTVRVEEIINTFNANGVCRYANPYKGPTKISCRAETPAGSFAGDFTTDGSTPTVTK
jgi:hypothetical protein